MIGSKKPGQVTRAAGTALERGDTALALQLFVALRGLGTKTYFARSLQLHKLPALHLGARLQPDGIRTTLVGGKGCGRSTTWPLSSDFEGNLKAPRR
jgi:hypothetical protein